MAYLGCSGALSGCGGHHGGPGRRDRGGRGPGIGLAARTPPLYTSGTSGKQSDLLDARFPIFATGRGGQLTYHGPGQRVAYVMLDLKRRRPMSGLCREPGGIDPADAGCLQHSRRAARGPGWRLGQAPRQGADHEDKIAAIGVRLKRWVSFHGIAINVEPELSHFAGIVPCGVADPRYGVTSLVDLGQLVTMADVDIALRQTFEELFGPTRALLPEAVA